MSVVGELHMHGYGVTNYIRSTITFQNAAYKLWKGNHAHSYQI